jgi:hypothetical protein
LRAPWSSSSRRRRGPALAAAGLAALLAVGLAALGVRAQSGTGGLDVTSARVYEADDTLGAEIRLSGFWSPRVRQSLERGMPASLLVTVDLWRDRAGWFDRLETVRSVVYRVRFDAWREDYDLVRAMEPVRHLASLTLVARELSRPMRVPLVRTEDLAAGHRHYVVVTASLRPLTPEGVREVEQFLSSQLRGGEQGAGAPGSVSIGRLPNSLLSMLAALSGLGDEIAVHRTPGFVVPERRRPALDP